MTFKARVHVERTSKTGTTEQEYLGEIDLDLRPILELQITLVHKGRREVGQIVSVAPPNWEQRGVIPFVRVLQR